MGLRVGNIKRPKGYKKEGKRLGRGIGSGKGKTSGKGHKGAKARSGGGTYNPGFEGGQMPIYRRLPKRGFKNIWRKEVQIVQLRDLVKLPPEADVEPETLKQAGLIESTTNPVKLLGNENVERAYMVRSLALSKSAREKITSAGGSVAE